MLCLVIGILPWVGASSAGVRILAVVALLAGVVVALVAWGLLQSISADRQRAEEAELDAVLIEAAGPAGACSCGHEHDPDELHITDACEHDGAGAACGHDCDSCVLASLRQ